MYARVSGDFPASLFNRVKPEFQTLAESLNDEEEENYKFVAITWNACGMEAGFVQDLVAQLDAGPRWDAIFLQEGPYSEHNEHRVVDGGHFLYTAACASGQKCCHFIAPAMGFSQSGIQSRFC